MKEHYGNTVALQYEGPQGIEPENLIAALADAADRLERNYIETVVRLGLDKKTTELHIDYDDGKGQYILGWEATR